MRFNCTRLELVSMQGYLFSLQNELCHCKWTHRLGMLELKSLLVVM